MPAKVTPDPSEALRIVADGLPVVLVRPDPGELGRLLAKAPDPGARTLLLAVMVGDLADPAVAAAAAEMAAELWPAPG